MDQWLFEASQVPIPLSTVFTFLPEELDIFEEPKGSECQISFFEIFLIIRREMMKKVEETGTWHAFNSLQ